MRRIENGRVGGILCGARRWDGWTLQLESTLQLFSFGCIRDTLIENTCGERKRRLVYVLCTRRLRG